MTTKEMIEVLQAFEDGKEIEMQLIDRPNLWVNAKTPSWDFLNVNYRIKPEPPKPKYIPFEMSDHMAFIGEKVKTKNNISIVNCCDAKSVLIGDDWFFYEYCLNRFTFMDGTPFGKLKE